MASLNEPEVRASPSMFPRLRRPLLACVTSLLTLVCTAACGCGSGHDGASVDGAASGGGGEAGGRAGAHNGSARTRQGSAGAHDGSAGARSGSGADHGDDPGRLTGTAGASDGRGGLDSGGSGALPGSGGADRPGGGNSPGSGAPSGNAGAPSSSSGGAYSGGTGGQGFGGAAGEPGVQQGGAPSEEMPASTVFDERQVVEYRVTLAPADWTELEEHGDEEVYLPASLEVNGSEVGTQSFASVGIRHKGSWTLHHCWDDFGGVRSYEAECAKLSFKIKFNEYQPDARYENLKQLNLHAASGDATKLREMLAYSTFRDFGVDAPRTAPAKLYINEEFQGLFIAVEAIDGRFTAFHFPDGGNGNLYKEVWPRAGLADQHFLDALETNEEVADVSDMQGFSAAVGAATDATFLSDMEPWVEVEALLRYVAVDRASKNWDGIMAFYSPEKPHNYYWYHDDGPQGRFHLIPWDLDNTFWEFDPFAAPEQWVTASPVPDWNVLPASCNPVPVWEPTSDTRVTPPGCDPFHRLLASTQWERFVAIAQELLNGPLRYETMLTKVTHWASVVDPILTEDPYVDVAEWREEKELFPSILERAIADFSAFLAAGYTVQEPEPELREPSQEELDAPLPECGLVLDRVNNYEFTGGVASDPPAGVFWYGADGITGAPVWNTIDPQSGTADLRFDYEFVRMEGPWNEWIDVALPTDGGEEVDISEYAQISMTLQTDAPRVVRVRLSSPAYDDEFGGAWVEFGTEFSVSPTPTTFKMRFDDLYYPEWAKDDWGATDAGWTTSDEEALQLLLTRFDGLRFAPQATTTDDGELVTETESGTLQIDNIYFQ